MSGFRKGLPKYRKGKAFLQTNKIQEGRLWSAPFTMSCGRIDAVLAFCLTIFIFPQLGQAQTSTKVEGDIQKVGDATHLEFTGKSSWTYDLKREKRGAKEYVKVRIPALSNLAKNKLRTWSGPLIRGIEVNENGPDGSFELTFQVRDSGVEAFDYLTDDPSRLIIDFYRKKKSKSFSHKKSFEQPVAIVEEKKIKSISPQKTVKKRKVKSRKIRAQRSPASDFVIQGDPVGNVTLDPLKDKKEFLHGIYDGADPKIWRFRIKPNEIDPDAILASRRNIYLRFPPISLGLPFLDSLQKNPPIYEVRPKETEENKVARLLIKLFNDKKISMFTKTLNFFKEQFPDSPYMEIAGYLEADIHYHLWMETGSPVEFEAAMIKYRQMVERYPRSTLVERTLMLLGYSYLKKNDSLGALKILQYFLNRNPDTKYWDKAQLANAEALLRLNRFSESFRTYQKVSAKARFKKHAAEADFLMGDVHFKKGDFKKAISSYDRALGKHPHLWRQYPNTFFNKAEALFWAGKYKESVDRFIDFLSRFPDHVHGGFAMTRLGELLEILGAPEKRIMGAFLESHFRYRSTEGGKLARVRVLTGKMKKMEDKQVEDALEELEKIENESTLDKTGQFISVKTADGLYERRNFERSTQKLVQYYQKNPTKTNLPVLESRIVRNIAAMIDTRLEKRDFIGALKTYYKYKDNWLKRSNRLDIGYFLGLSFEQAGAYDEASREYRKTLNQIYSLKGTSAGKEKEVFESPPSSDRLNLRLAAVSIEKKNFREANDFLKEITRPDELTQREKIEVVELAARVSEERGQFGMAKNFLRKVSENWSGQPEMVVGPYLKLADLHLRAKDYNRALDSVQKVIHLATDTKNVSEEDQFKAMSMKAEILLKRGRRKDSVKTFQKILSQFSEKKDLKSMRYKTGKVLFDMGDVKEAEKVWAPLSESEAGIWSNLAKENLSGKKWDKKYQKYINRIPAMEGFEE